MQKVHCTVDPLFVLSRPVLQVTCTYIWTIHFMESLKNTNEIYVLVSGCFCGWYFLCKQSVKTGYALKGGIDCTMRRGLCVNVEVKQSKGQNHLSHNYRPHLTHCQIQQDWKWHLIFHWQFPAAQLLHPSNRVLHRCHLCGCIKDKWLSV